jgi:hypothetical protein
VVGSSAAVSAWGSAAVGAAGIRAVGAPGARRSGLPRSVSMVRPETRGSGKREGNCRHVPHDLAAGSGDFASDSVQPGYSFTRA